MLLIPCPYCGERSELEFSYGGEAHLVRGDDPDEQSDAAWTAYLYLRRNTRGRHIERWRHVHGCGRFFNAIRDTCTDRFVTSYASGRSAPEIGQ